MLGTQGLIDSFYTALIHIECMYKPNLYHLIMGK